MPCLAPVKPFVTLCFAVQHTVWSWETFTIYIPLQEMAREPLPLPLPPRRCDAANFTSGVALYMQRTVQTLSVAVMDAQKGPLRKRRSRADSRTTKPVEVQAAHGDVGRAVKSCGFVNLRSILTWRFLTPAWAQPAIVLLMSAKSDLTWTFKPGSAFSVEASSLCPSRDILPRLQDVVARLVVREEGLRRHIGDVTGRAPRRAQEK